MRASVSKAARRNAAKRVGRRSFANPASALFWTCAPHPGRAHVLLANGGWRSIARAERPTRKRAHGRTPRSLLTPLPRRFRRHRSIEVARLGVQVHGGMGFIGKPAPRSFIAMRASPRSTEAPPQQEISILSPASAARGRRRETDLTSWRHIVEAVKRTNGSGRSAGAAWRLEEAGRQRTRATRWMLAHTDQRRERGAGRRDNILCAVAVAVGGCMVAQQALAAFALNADQARASRWRGSFAANIAVQARRLGRTIARREAGVALGSRSGRWPSSKSAFMSTSSLPSSLHEHSHPKPSHRGAAGRPARHSSTRSRPSNSVARAGAAPRAS